MGFSLGGTGQGSHRLMQLNLMRGCWEKDSMSGSLKGDAQIRRRSWKENEPCNLAASPLTVP